MTLWELSRYFRLMEQLTREEATIEALRSAADAGAAVITGMPHTPGVKDKTGNYAAEIADLSARIKYLKAEMAQEKTIVAAFVESVEDGFTRTVFRLRFLRCMTWKEVAQAVGGGNTENSVKKICYRTLNETE